MDMRREGRDGMIEKKSIDLLHSVKRTEQSGQTREQIEHHIRELLRLIGEDPMREGLRDTPKRVRKMYEEIFSGYTVDPREVLGVTFDEQHEELVLVKDIVFYSQCEHHMAPFFGHVHIAYVPSGRIAGLSKFARLVEAFSRKLQVQERLTKEIADTIVDVLHPHGVCASLDRAP
jgi:GTP cyclohydrolase I